MANVYNFGWLFDPTTAPAVGDATALERFCKQLNMCLAMAKDCNYVATPGRAAGTWVANTPATSGMGILSITTKYRLPSDLDPGAPAATTNGEIVASSSLFALRGSADTADGREMPNMDKPTVTRGAQVLAYLPAGVDVSDELDTQISWVTCDGQRIVMGKATQDMIPGTGGYVPFASAWAYSTIGNKIATSSTAPTAVAITSAVPRR